MAIRSYSFIPNLKLKKNSFGFPPSKFKLELKDYEKIEKQSQPITIFIENDKININGSKSTSSKIPLNLLEKYINTAFGLPLKSDKIKEYYKINSFAGTRFVIFNDNTAELTTYGSGAPITNSLIGKLIEIKN